MKNSVNLTIAGLALAIASARGAEPDTPGSHDGPPKIEFLENACITADGGVYYLTGTAGTYDRSGKVDFDYNRGAPLWKSSDLTEWEPVGYVFDRARLLNSTRGRPKIGYWLDWNAPSERIDALNRTIRTMVRALGERLFSLHVHDIRESDWRDHRCVGSGVVDFPELFTELRRMGYTGLFEVELEEPEREAAATETGVFLTRLCRSIAVDTAGAARCTGDASRCASTAATVEENRTE